MRCVTDFSVVLCGVALCLAVNCRGKTGQGPSGNPTVISDPHEYARKYWDWAKDLYAGPLPLEELLVDIDHDGRPELFLSCPCDIGNAGKNYLVFKEVRKEGKVIGFTFLGDLFMHPLAYSVLPLDKDGRPRLVIYLRQGKGEWEIHWVTNKDGRFVVDRTEYGDETGEK